MFLDSRWEDKRFSTQWWQELLSCTATMNWLHWKLRVNFCRLIQVCVQLDCALPVIIFTMFKQSQEPHLPVDLVHTQCYNSWLFQSDTSPQEVLGATEHSSCVSTSLILKQQPPLCMPVQENNEFRAICKLSHCWDQIIREYYQALLAVEVKCKCLML